MNGDRADQAAENLTEWHRDRFAAALLDTAGLKRLPPPRFLVDGLLQLDSTAELYGKAGLGKSFVALDLACHVAVGRRWHGHRVEQGTVFYVTAEAPQGMGQRVQAWEDYHSLTVPPGAVTWLPLPVQLGDHQQFDGFLQVVAKLDQVPVLFVFDTRARCTVGVEENSNRDIGAVFSLVDELRRTTGACCLTLHHPSAAGDKARGATAYLGAVDTELLLKAEGEGFDLRVEKQRNTAEAPKLHLALQPFGPSAVVVAVDQVHREGTFDAVLLEQLEAIAVPGEAVPRGRWFEAVQEVVEADGSKVSVSTLMRASKRLQESNQVERTGHGYYRLVVTQ